MPSPLRRFRFPDKPTRCAPGFVERLNAAEWVSQSKYDGWRLNIYNSPGGVELPDGTTAKGLSLLTSSGSHFSSIRRVTMTPEIRRQIERLELPAETVVDAEFVGPRGNHKPAVYVFDLLAYEGLWLVNMPYAQRWSMCLGLLTAHGIGLNHFGGEPDKGDIHVATTRGDFLPHFNELKALWLKGGLGMDLCEGIVLKRLTGKMALSLSGPTHSGVSYKLKYREIVQPTSY